MLLRKDETYWEINSRPVWFRLPIKDIWQHRDLLFRFVRRDFLASYQQTILGPVWIFLQPLLITFTYVAIFKSVLGVSTNNQPSALFYLGGIILWNYFSESLVSISYSYLSYSSIFNKVYFPRIIVAISYLLSNLIRLGIQFILFLLIFFFCLYHHTIFPNWQIILMPFYLILLSGISMGLGLIFASLTAKYRDIQNLLNFILRIWMFVSPIIYPLSLVPGKYKILLLINPLTTIIELFRYAFLGNGYHAIAGLLYCFIFMIIVLTVGIFLFNRRDGLVIDII